MEAEHKLANSPLAKRYPMSMSKAWVHCWQSALPGALQRQMHQVTQKGRVQVRRKADPAKNLVKGWIQDWKERSELEQEVSHRELSGDAAAHWYFAA